MNQFKKLILSMFILLGTGLYANTVNMAPIISYLLSDTTTQDSNSTNDEKKSVDMILNIVTIMDDNIPMEGVLGAGYEAKIALLDVNDTNLTLTVSTSLGDQNISTYQLSDDQQTITFLVPQNIIEGELSLQTQTTQSNYSYKVLTAQSPYIVSLAPDIVQVGDSVTITGVNLPSMPIQVVFEGQSSSLTQTVTPSSGNTVSFTVPQGAGSGYVNLQIDQVQTNSLFLSVKRRIDAHIALGQDISFDSSEISFILGLEEYTLDENYNIFLNVENNDMQYLHAVVELPDDEAAILYSAVVLPDMTGIVTIDANSTAVTWIFMGMGASAATTKDNLRALYDTVKANAKVQEFATYINTLQENDFNAWATQSDTTLINKFQDALKDVLENPINGSVSTPMSLVVSPEGVIVEQEPDNDNIKVDMDNLDKGSVTIINDTKLYLSAEVTSNEEGREGEIVYGYKHAANAVLTDSGTLIGPQTGGAFLDIASSTTLEVAGEDCHIQIITPGVLGSTDQTKLSDSLRARVVIEGVAIPGLNMILEIIMDQRIASGYKPSRFVEAMDILYVNGGFLNQLTTQVSTADNSVYAVVDTMVLTPVWNGLQDCLKPESGALCDATVSAVAQLIGGFTGVENIKNKILSSIAVAKAKNLAKKSLALIPYAGQITAGAIWVYDNLGFISNTSTFTKTLWDMRWNTKEINIDVNFPFEVSEVTPTCTVNPPDTIQRFYIYGEGFTAIDGEKPLVSIGSDDNKTESFDLYTNDEGTQMVARFYTSDLLDKGSWSSDMFIEYTGISINYYKAIRMVSTEDEKVYFDSVIPNRAMLGQTVTLIGCGWVPLEDVKVYFTSEDGEVEATDIDSRAIDAIKVKVPETAISGSIRVSVGDKEEIAHIDVIPLGLFSTTTDTLTDGKQFTLQGKGLTSTAYVYFKDHEDNILEGTASDIQDTSIYVEAPDGLEVGPVRLYVVLGDGTKSNELILSKVPISPIANPSDGAIGNEGMTVSLSQEEGADIYYWIDSGVQQQYTGPIQLTLADMTADSLTLHAIARVSVDGVDYNSDEANINGYVYNACAEGEVLNADRQCVEGVVHCPVVYDPSLDPDGYYTIYFNVQDNDRLVCEYQVSDNLLILETPIINGLKDGIVKYYGRTAVGEIYLHVELFYSVGVKFLEKTYYDTGVLRSEEPYTDGIRDGISKWYFPSGVLQVEIPYTMNVINGTKNVYYDVSGMLKEETPYVDGIIHGIYNWYFETGILYIERPYENGLQQGIEKQYFETGVLYRETPYENDLKQGIERIYYSSGALQRTIPYIDDVVHGTVYNYTESQCVLLIQYYENGTLIDEEFFSCT